MDIDLKISKRFDDLINVAAQLLGTRNTGSYPVAGVYRAPYDKVDSEKASQWGISCLHVLRTVFGETSDHYAKFDSLFSQFPDFTPVKKAFGILKAAKEDYSSGFVFNLQSAISGEIFQDFVELAKRALAEGNKDVAAVLACAALEDTLKRYAQKQGLAVDDKDMTDVVAALKSQGLVSGAQKTLLSTMPKIRNYAMHANWDKITEPDVNSVIGFVEQFLITYF
ncbi:MAG: DUF4145 domain-containing protein [Acidobacteria bacterium]|nr:DUF4145 domain-containing protein [Acidobacteriota bacterium]